MTNDKAMWLINKIVATNFGMKVSEITIKTRRAEVVKPRQIAQDLCYEILDITQEELAKFYKMERTTLVHSFRMVVALRSTHREYNNLYCLLKYRSKNIISAIQKFEAIKSSTILKD